MAVHLDGLEGENPLGFLAALGVLRTVAASGRSAALNWTDELVPHAVLSGVTTVEDLIELLEQQRPAWARTVSLRGPTVEPLPDAKPNRGELRSWAEAVLTSTGEDVELFSALVAEGAYDGKGVAKPTHLHFTAGQQKFLVMARELAERVDTDRLREAVVGPWRSDSTLPSFSWDAGTERIYALRGTDPSKQQRFGVPGADWLALIGLSLYPVALVRDALQTPGCDRYWKRGNFRWPLWEVRLPLRVVASLVADPDLVSERPQRRRTAPEVLAARGVLRVMEAPIRRNQQGGYGSFSAARTLARAAGQL